MFYDLINLKPNIVLIFKTCPSMTNICTTIGLYAKSFDNQISRVSMPFLPQIDQTCHPFVGHIWPKELEISKSEITRHDRPLDQTYPAARTYPVL
jgi:hypothetical protein